MTPSLPSRLAGECAGTAVLVGIGTGTIVGAARIGGIAQGLMALAWFTAVLLPVLLFLRTSGAHLNPVVTLGLAVGRRMPWNDVPPYVASQFLGAFLGSGIVWASLGSGAHLGATVPSTGDLFVVFGSEFVFTAALLASVFVLADAPPGWGRWPIVLPPTVVGVSTYCIGPITGSSLNPARTLAPAVLSGTYTDLPVYLVAVTAGALIVALSWRAVRTDRSTRRGPGPTSGVRRGEPPIAGASSSRAAGFRFGYRADPGGRSDQRDGRGGAAHTPDRSRPFRRRSPRTGRSSPEPSPGGRRSPVRSS